MAPPLDPAGLAAIGEAVARHVGDDSVPGLVALVAHGDEVHVEVAGTLSVGGTPVRRDSLFRLSSITKPVTGAATMSLVDDGLIGLEDPVEMWLPELAGRRVLRRIDGPLDDTVAAVRPVTVRDLLTFTFGFGMDMAMFAAAQPWPVVAAAARLHLATLGPPNPSEPADPDRWMAGLGTLPLMAQPGERWLYNTSAQVLGVLLARAAGAPLDDVLRTRLFEPLGMHHTAFWTAETARLATAYAGGEDGLVVLDPPDGQWSRPPAFPDAAAGLVSTADDLLAFARMLLGRGAEVLSPRARALMTSDQLTAEQRRDGQAILQHRSWGFCQSVVTEGPFAGAFGWDGGLGTSFLVDPRRDLVVMVFTQRLFDGPVLPPVHEEVQAAALAAVS